MIIAIVVCVFILCALHLIIKGALDSSRQDFEIAKKMMEISKRKDKK